MFLCFYDRVQERVCVLCNNEERESEETGKNR